MEALGAVFARPDDAPGDADVVFHTSATSAGLDTAIKCAGFEGTIVEMSWYGDKPVSVHLGGAFHSRRLRLVSSQVGAVAASRRARWDYRRRSEAALRLLARARFRCVGGRKRSPSRTRPASCRASLRPDAAGLAPVIRYSHA